MSKLFYTLIFCHATVMAMFINQRLVIKFLLTFSSEQTSQQPACQIMGPKVNT